MNLRAIVLEIKKDLVISGPGEAESSQPPSASISSTTTLVFEGQEFDACPIWNRSSLKTGHVIVGPCVIEEMDSNTVIHPGYKCEIDGVGNILILEVEKTAASNVKAAKEGLDVVAVEIFESALRNARNEMDTLMTRSTMSPAIREQQDEFNVIAEPGGKMIVGQFGSFIGDFLNIWKGTIEPGDIFLTNDPYSVDGAVSHHNDWLILMPIFVEKRLSRYITSLTGRSS